MSQKPKPKIDKLRNNVRGTKSYNWDLGGVCFVNPGKRKVDPDKVIIKDPVWVTEG